MHYELFQDIQRQTAGQKAHKSSKKLKQLNSILSAKEKIVIYPFLTMILTMLTISGWSAILLAIGKTETGGPIGMVARALFNI